MISSFTTAITRSTTADPLADPESGKMISHAATAHDSNDNDALVVMVLLLLHPFLLPFGNEFIIILALCAERRREHPLFRSHFP
jgi:hypothetical protein